jgi:hypothetical protein
MYELNFFHLLVSLDDEAEPADEAPAQQQSTPPRPRATSKKPAAAWSKRLPKASTRRHQKTAPVKKLGRPYGTGIAEFPSEQYRAQELQYHRFHGFNFKGKNADVEYVAKVVADDMTERFTQGLYIPRNAPVDYRG